MSCTVVWGVLCMIEEPENCNLILKGYNTTKQSSTSAKLASTIIISAHALAIWHNAHFDTVHTMDRSNLELLYEVYIQDRNQHAQ